MVPIDECCHMTYFFFINYLFNEDKSSVKRRLMVVPWHVFLVHPCDLQHCASFSMFFVVLLFYRKVCRVIKVISPDADKNDSTAMEINDSDDDVICLDDPAPTKKKVKDDR